MWFNPGQSTAPRDLMLNCCQVGEVAGLLTLAPNIWSKTGISFHNIYVGLFEPLGSCQQSKHMATEYANDV